MSSCPVNSRNLSFPSNFSIFSFFVKPVRNLLKSQDYHTECPLQPTLNAKSSLPGPTISSTITPFVLIDLFTRGLRESGYDRVDRRPVPQVLAGT